MLTQYAPKRANRPLTTGLSSIARGGLAALLALSAGLSLPACAQPAPGTDGHERLAAGDRLDTAFSTWRALTTSPGAGFATIASFLLSHPGWPGEADLRKQAESALRADADSPAQVAAFFKAFAPQSASGHLRYAEALQALNQRDEAAAAARGAWLAGAMTPEDEARFLGRFASALQPGDHDARMERLLWSRATTHAARQLPWTSPERRAVFDARLAFISKSPDAGSKAGFVPAAQQRDAGYIADRVFWLRNTGQAATARAWLATMPPPATPPSDPMRWLDMLEGVIDSAAKEGQFGLVAGVARQVQHTYPADVAARDRPANERNGYTDVAWKGGFAALENLNRPRDALWFFDLYAKAARSPQTRAKGLYWAGRAADRAGDRATASAYYTQAAEFFDQFHGQLAAEKLGKPLSIPQEFTTAEVSGAERQAFNSSDLVRVATWLGRTGQWRDQSRFIRAIVSRAQTPGQHVLGAELATRINRPDLALLIGRSAREKGLPGYARFAFPMMRVPDEHVGNWTMIHAITRQESQFDREALSRAGARGLMQLMPGTARMTAPAAGVIYDIEALTSDPQHNIKLGSTYFGQMMTRFNGSYVLAVAAYNAGPGNVNKWLAANGDPRQPGVDVLDWIERIPFTETRGYVQRVLENAAVYEMLNPRRSVSQPPVRLSSWLGGSATAFGSR